MPAGKPGSGSPWSLFEDQVNIVFICYICKQIGTRA